MAITMLTRREGRKITFVYQTPFEKCIYTYEQLKILIYHLVVVCIT